MGDCSIYLLPNRLVGIWALRDWSIIMGRGGYKIGISQGLKLFATPPPTQNRKNFLRHPFYRVETFCAPSSAWLKLQAPVLKLPQNLLCSPLPSAWPKLFLLHPLSIGVKLAPPLLFCSPPLSPYLMTGPQEVNNP